MGLAMGALHPVQRLARAAEGRVNEALRHSRAVALLGARQVGKSTLAERIARSHKGRYVSLDDAATRDAIRRDPAGFLDGPALLVIDEFQRGGEPLLLAVKRHVDTANAPGRVLLTGSTRYTTMPDLSESLAGRVEIIDLWPLSQGEVEARPDQFVDRLFGQSEVLRRRPTTTSDRVDAFDRLTAGGYPAVHRLPARARGRWYDGYVRTLTQRDVREFSRAQSIDVLPRLLKLLAARTAQELNLADVARDLDMARTTLPTYVALLETIYLIHRLPAWSRNLTKKAVKHPKLHFVDAGLAAHLLGATTASLCDPRSVPAGPLLETFVVGELARQRTWADLDVDLFHLRDHDGAEVDLIVEARDGRLAGVEVKASATVSVRDFRGLDLLHDRLPRHFTHGVVLYLGTEILPFGDRRTALPLSALWN